MAESPQPYAIVSATRVNDPDILWLLPRMHLRTAFVSILALGLVAWFLRHANIADVWAQVGQARVDLLILAFVCVMLTYWARAVRWHYLLAPVGHTRFRTVFRTTVIGFAALAILPARVGDVLRPYLLARREGLSTTATFATVVMERVLDLIAVLALLAIYVLGFTGDTGLPERLCARSRSRRRWPRRRQPSCSGVMWVLGDASRADRRARGRGRAGPSAAVYRAASASWRARSAAASRRRVSRARCSWPCSGRFRCGSPSPPRPGPSRVAFGIDMPFAGRFCCSRCS